MTCVTDPCPPSRQRQARRVGHPKIEERLGKIGSPARAVSHPSVICALAEAKPGAVSVECEGEVVVCSVAALSVREEQVPVVNCQTEGPCVTSL